MDSGRYGNKDSWGYEVFESRLAVLLVFVLAKMGE